MKPTEHVAYGAVASAALYPAYGIETVFFFAGSVLIDIDHYLDFLYFSGFRDWSISSMFRFHGQSAKWIDRPDLMALEAFHTAEFILALLAVGLYFNSTPVLLLWSGMVFHLALDLWRLHRLGNKTHIRARSFVEYWIKARRWRRAGIDPERFFREAYALSSSRRPTP